MSELQEVAENNDRAVILSEELDFLEALLEEYGDRLEAGAIADIIERRDIVRDAIRSSDAGAPLDEADEGTELPAEAEDSPEDEAEDVDDG